MKKIKIFMNRNASVFMGLFMLMFIFAACKKDTPDYVRTPAAGLMAFNMAPDQPAVAFALSGNTLGNSLLGFTNFTGVYLPVFIGNREVRAFDFSTGNTLAITPGVFADSMYYSVLLVGNAGKYENLLVNDKLDSLTTVPGKAWVRYINAVPDSVSTPTISIGENNINETAAYKMVSSFKLVDAGTVNTSISNGGNISATRLLTLSEYKVYTVLFAGLPGATDTNKQVQVRFIENGTVAP